MSRRMPSGPSSGPLNAASTTYVAPCRRCAGPNTSPVKLWAIIMWSRTVTVYMSVLVVDRVAQRGLAGGQPGHHVRQLGEGRAAGEQGVEGRVAQQLQR